jgi:4-oxalocrotonate tautomerase
MPIIEVTLIEGRSPEKKKALIKALTKATEEAIGAPPQSIRVILREVPGEHFGVAGEAKGKAS